MFTINSAEVPPLDRSEMKTLYIRRYSAIFGAGKKRPVVPTGTPKCGLAGHGSTWRGDCARTARRCQMEAIFWRSSQVPLLYGRSEAHEAATMDGPLHAGMVFCPCKACRAHDFSPGACEMRAEYGAYKLEYARRSKPPATPRVTRTQALEEFAASLHKDQVGHLNPRVASSSLHSTLPLCVLGSNVSRLVFSGTCSCCLKGRAPDRGQRVARPTLRRCVRCCCRHGTFHRFD